jgi:oligopeptidase B
MEDLPAMEPAADAVRVSANAGDASPPRAAQKPVRRVEHGLELIDEYAWLAERGSLETLGYLEAENDYANAMLRSARPLREALYEEFLGRIKETDQTVPVRLDEYFYYGRTEKGREYRIFCRRKGDLEAPEEIILDPNQLGEGEEFFRVGAVEVSPDHRRLAYSVDVTGGESFELRVRDLGTGEHLEVGISAIAAGLCWGSDSRTLFYTSLDAARRPYRVWRHLLESGEDDQEIYREEDEAFFVSVRRARSREVLFIDSASNVASEVHYLPADGSSLEPLVVEPRRPAVEYSVDHRPGFFLIRTNDEARNFRLLERPVGGASTDDREVMAHRPEVKIEDVDLFAEHLVIWEREQGLQRLRVRELEGAREFVVELPEPVFTIYPESNPEFGNGSYRFGYTSLVTPNTVFECDLATGALETLKVREVGDYDRDLYVTSRIHARAQDGVEVPISLVHRRDLVADGSNPCLLAGYGAYGTVIDPVFSPVSVSLLDRGLVLATAHVRGGGLLGESWHEDGRMLSKRNTFTDFIACAETLVEQGLVASDRLAVRGGSAGGLLLGAVLNMRPELFRAAIARVPFVDVINTMFDQSIPLTVIEFEEWGNPEDREYFEYMLGYSPYDNVREQAYPAMLVSAGLNDPRVQYWEPAKWVARLRARKSDDNLLLLRTHMGAGHGGPAGRYKVLEERALEYAFLLGELDVPPAASG